MDGRICANQTSYDWFTYPKHSRTLSLSKTTQRNFIRELNEMFDNQIRGDHIST